MKELERKPVENYKSKLKINDIDKIHSIGCSCSAGGSASGGSCCCGDAAKTIARR